MKNWMILLFLLGALGSRAQTLQEPHYPRHYFRDPLEIPMTLAGNFGELREGHFHAGIDIKTEGREGLPVHAAAAGYISQISVSAGGYGNLICITHPNGLITLYGHLSRFFPALASYVSRREYAGRQWAIELNFTPDQFPVIQGQLIGWSGSTGDAAGPHLHFEIRNAATDQALNPLLFGFAVRDDEAPQVMGLAVYDRDRSIYEQDPLEVALKKEVGSYVPATGLIRTPALHAGFGIHALDRQNGTHNIYGIYEAVLFQGDHPDIGFRLDGIAPDLSRYVDAHVDYKTHFSGGPNYQLLFQIPGNRLAIYHSLGGDGTVDLSDGKIHPVRILVKDASGNTSVILFQIQHEGPPPAAAPPCALWMGPGKVIRFDSAGISFTLGARELYDVSCFHFGDLKENDPSLYSDRYQLNTGGIPLFGNFQVFIRPNREIPAPLRDKMVLVCQDGRKRHVEPATWQGDWLSAEFRNFGSFALEADQDPPLIRQVLAKRRRRGPAPNRIAFRITDGLSGVASYTAELDGQWLMFARKGDLIWYDYDAHCPRGAHTLILTVSDAVQNRSAFVLHFKR